MGFARPPPALIWNPPLTTLAKPSATPASASVCPFADAVRTQVARTVVGQQVVVERVLIALLTGGHLLLEGVPGIAKTLLVQSVAKAIDLKFKCLGILERNIQAHDTMHVGLVSHCLRDACRNDEQFVWR